MNANANATIIRIGRSSGKTYGFGLGNQSDFDLGELFELPSKSSNICYHDFFEVSFNGNSIVIRIKPNTDVVIMNYHPSSTPLHVHTISHQNDYTIFVIFDDHILRIRLKNSEFVECKTNTFYISSELLQSIIKKSFSTINGGQILRACFVVDKGNFNQFESYNLLLDNEGERIFYKHKGFSFRLPAKITNIEINDTYINLEDDDRNYIFLKWTRKSINCSISIVDRKVDSFYVLKGVTRLFLIKEYEGFCISQTDKIPRFEMLDFETVATLHVYFSQEITIPEGEIQRLLKLNSYCGWSIESDSEPDSDSDCCSDSD
jgi:hypothetical protein